LNAFTHTERHTHTHTHTRTVACTHTLRSDLECAWPKKSSYQRRRSLWDGRLFSLPTSL